MKIPEPSSAEFLQMAMSESMDEIVDVLREVAKLWITNKYSLSTVPPTWQAIKDLPEQEAVDTVIRMISQTPYFRSDGLAFAKRIFDGLGAQDGANG